MELSRRDAVLKITLVVIVTQTADAALRGVTAIEADASLPDSGHLPELGQRGVSQTVPRRALRVRLTSDRELSQHS